MKQKLLFFAFTLISAMLFSQAQNMAFEDFKTNDGTQNFFYKNIAKTDASGNIYTLGATTTSNSTTDILLTKKNSSGVSLWSKQINGTANYHDFGSGLAITSSGDVYITGAITNNTTTLAPELIIRKYNSSGSQQFSTTYSGAGYGAVGKDIVVDGSGNSYITGAEYNSGFNADILTIAFGSTGTQIWTDLFDNNSLNDGGVKIGFRSNKVTVTGAVTQSTNNYKIATLTFTASTGVRSETITLGSTMTSSVEIVTGMTTDASGNTYICGATEVSGQGFNMYVAKLTSSLTIAWQQTYNGVSNLDDQAKGIQVDGSGNVYITGYSTSSTLGKEIRTIKYNSSGTLQWNNVINSTGNNPDQAFDMEMDASSNIYVCGSISSDINQLDYYTVKYNSGGTKIWDIQTDGNHLNDYATNICLDTLNNVVVAGQTEISSGVYNYTAVKYSQRDVLIPIDINSEPANEAYQYYTNLGQVTTYSGTPAPLAKYYTNSSNPKIYLNSTRNYFVYTKGDTLLSTNDSIVRMDLTFQGADTLAKSYNFEETTGFLNYFLNNLPKPIVGLKGNNRILVPNLYPNIDLHIYNNINGIKYYFVLKPGATLSNINFKFTGASTTTVVSNEIDVNCYLKHLKFSQPKVYQINGTPAIINSGNGTWRSLGSNTYGILSSVTTNTALSTIIMVETNKVSSPTANGNIQWSTFIGDGFVKDLRVNKNNGKQYLTGSSSGNFPVFNGLYVLQPYASLPDAFIAQFSNKNARDWISFYGGTANINDYYKVADFGTGVDYDAQGNVYCMGYTWSDSIPTKASSTGSSYFQSKSPFPGSGYNSNMFVVKIDSTGGIANSNQVIWCTYIGGAPNEESTKIRVANNNFYMVGKGGTGVGSNPTPLHFKTGAYNQDSIGQTQIYKFTNNLVYNWGTNFGNPISSTGNFINNLDWDATSGLAITGYASALSLPTTVAGANIPYKGGLSDAYWTIFDSNDNVKYCTYIGGGGYDEGFDLVMDKGLSYVVGTTSSNATKFPVKYSAGQYIDSLYNGSQDGFISAFNNNTGNLSYSSYYGGSANDIIYGVCSDYLGGIYIHGTTNSTDLVTSGATGLYTQTSSSSADETFLCRLSSTSNDFNWRTYVGGTGNDGAVKISSYSNKSVYITGSGVIASNTFPTNPGIVGTSYFSNNGTIYLSKFDLTSFYVGINEITKDNSNDVIVFPNPTTGMIYVKGNTIFSKLEVYNTMGQKVLEDSNTNSINVQSLATGIYILRICSKEDYQSVKIIKH